MSDVSSAAVVRLDASGPQGKLDLAELWHYRHLLRLLAWRDLRVKYAQTLIGVLWAIIQPLATMVFFGLFFGRIARLPSDGLPYPIFYFSGLLPWLYVSHVVSSATNVLHEHARLIGRVYFPRVVMPLASVLGGLVDFAISFAFLMLMLVWYGLPLSARSLAVVAFVGLAVLTAAALGMWLSALNSRFRDVKYGLAFALQFWLLASPVVYPMTMVPAAWRPIYALNPMAVVIQGFRWSLTGHGFPGALPIAVSGGTVLALGLTGLWYFRRTEVLMADRL